MTNVEQIVALARKLCVTEFPQYDPEMWVTRVAPPVLMTSVGPVYVTPEAEPYKMRLFEAYFGAARNLLELQAQITRGETIPYQGGAEEKAP